MDIFFNGILSRNGEYLSPPISSVSVAKHVSEDIWHRYKSVSFRRKALPWGCCAEDLRQSGWGAIFPHGQDASIRTCLGELLAHRRHLVGSGPGVYREFHGVDGYRKGESKSSFLQRFGVGWGPVDPSRIPYHLLLVGSPEEIPWEFQYQLDLQFSVGRLFFSGIDGYKNYSASVLRHESVPARRSGRAAFLATTHHRDAVTQSAARFLVRPLVRSIRSEIPSVTVDSHIGRTATKSKLVELLGGRLTPSFLFISAHGLGFEYGDPRQHDLQGAIICQDWPGRGSPVLPSYYLSAHDVDSSCVLEGLICLFLCCYSAGTPRDDNFGRGLRFSAGLRAFDNFCAALPLALLGHRRGCLAVIGHVDRAWTWSFRWRGASVGVVAFRSLIAAILNGATVGSAVEVLNARYSELAAELNFALQGDTVKSTDNVARIWLACNDARNYVLLGDPAVRLSPCVREVVARE